MEKTSSAAVIWAWVLFILLIIALGYAVHEHNAASTANATLQSYTSGASGNGTEAPMIPAVTSSTTVNY